MRGEESESELVNEESESANYRSDPNGQIAVI